MKDCILRLDRDAFGDRRISGAFVGLDMYCISPPPSVLQVVSRLFARPESGGGRNFLDWMWGGGVFPRVLGLVASSGRRTEATSGTRRVEDHRSHRTVHTARLPQRGKADREGEYAAACYLVDFLASGIILQGCRLPGGTGAQVREPFLEIGSACRVPGHQFLLRTAGAVGLRQRGCVRAISDMRVIFASRSQT